MLMVGCLACLEALCNALFKSGGLLQTTCHSGCIMMQTLKELQQEYENNPENVLVPIMYDEGTAYACDVGGQ